jgi:hypothetical protein
MHDNSRVDTRGVRPPTPILPLPTLAVWISSFFVLLHCVLNLLVGLLEVAQGTFEQVFPPPPNALSPLLDPFYSGVLNILLGVFLGWSQYAAVRYRNRVYSFVVGAAFFVLGVLVTLAPWGTPWDAAHYVLVGTALFVGISMVRWGRQLARR